MLRNTSTTTTAIVKTIADANPSSRMGQETGRYKCKAHSSLIILVRSLFVASGKSPCTPSFIALVKNMNAVVGLRTLSALRAGCFLIAACA